MAPLGVSVSVTDAKVTLDGISRSGGLHRRAEPKNGPKENKKTGNFKPLVFDEFQTGVETRG